MFLLFFIKFSTQYIHLNLCKPGAIKSICIEEDKALVPCWILILTYMSLISLSWYSRYLVSSYVLSIELLSLARLCEVSRAVAMAAANSKTSWWWWTAEKLKNRRQIKSQTRRCVRCLFNDAHITGVLVIINTLCRGICNHNSEGEIYLCHYFLRHFVII